MRTGAIAPVVGLLVRAHMRATSGPTSLKNFNTSFTCICDMYIGVFCAEHRTGYGYLVDNLHTGEKRLSSLKSYFLQFIPVVYYSRILTAE